MSSKKMSISILEKIIATFSLFSVGIFGIIWFFISYFSKRKISVFLKFNINQSIIIGVILYIINVTNNFLISTTIKYKNLNFISEFINSFFVIKKVRFYEFGLSFSYFELLLFAILIYLFIGILLGKKFFLPFISNITKAFSK